MVILAGWLKMQILEEAPKGLRPLTSAFWMAKTHTKKKFDVIVVGDSRVYRGISPAAMETVLKGMSVFNFGYSSAGMSAVLLNAAEEKLKTSGQRIIILGLTPYSLTSSAALNEQYKQYERAIFWPCQIPWLQPLMFPNETVWALTYRLGFKVSQYYQIPHSDGWVESDNPSESIDAALYEYRQRFAKEKISMQLFNYVLELVESWREKGYTVFAFRPPVSEKMENLENAKSGYDESLIKNEFSVAGGIWIDIEDRYAYKTYDGSHLTGESARLLSKYIAQFVSERIPIPLSTVKK
jgi:hypothetical protein